MSTGFLLAQELCALLRKSYHKGDMRVTLMYLVNKLKIGEFRIMLKRNFETACWIPPVGKRGSHSIYYGDRMLDAVLNRFSEVNEITLPSASSLAEEVVADFAKKGRKKPSRRELVPCIFDRKVEWLKANLEPDQWLELTEWLLKAVVSYGRHEREHARQTTRDMVQVTRDLRLLGLPFSLLNLFEDARIEHWSRQELGTNFDWAQFIARPPMQSPVSLMLRCILLEGLPDHEAVSATAPYPPRPALTVGEVAADIAEYYARACACTTSEQLYPLLVEFMAQFREDMKPPESEEGEGDESASGEGSGESSSSSKPGKDKPKPGKAGADGDEDGSSGSDDDQADVSAGDLSLAAEAAAKGDAFFDEFERDAEVIGGTDEEGKAAEEAAKAAMKGATGSAKPNVGATSQGIPESIAPCASGGCAKESDFLLTKAGTLDAVYKKRLADLTAILLRMFKVHSLSAATDNPGQRISSRHLARGELKFIQKRVFGGKGKRKFSMVYDCSGSMGGQPDREGKLFLLALNALAKRGLLEGTLVLSGWVNDKPGWLSYTFPVADELILRINPSHGSEGLQSALKDNLTSLKGMDDVFIYTDANICDAPIDRNYFAKHKIWPVGLYVGDDSSAGYMAKHFPQNIIKEHIEQVAETLLTRNRRTVG